MIRFIPSHICRVSCLAAMASRRRRASSSCTCSLVNCTSYHNSMLKLSSDMLELSHMLQLHSAIKEEALTLRNLADIAGRCVFAIAPVMSAPRDTTWHKELQSTVSNDQRCRLCETGNNSYQLRHSVTLVAQHACQLFTFSRALPRSLYLGST